MERTCPCPTCNEVKIEGEFLWCYDCHALTCSICYVSDHVTDSQLHPAAKWKDAQSGAIAHLTLLRNEVNQVEDEHAQAKDSIDRLVEEVRRDLHEGIVRKFDQKKAALTKAMSTIASAFPSTSVSADPVAIEYSDEVDSVENLSALLAHVKEVGGISDESIPPDILKS